MLQIWSICFCFWDRFIPNAALPTVGYASLLSVAGGRKRENACELKSNIFCNFGQAILTMLVIKSVLIGMILGPLIQYDLDIPHKCRATVLDLLLEQKYSYLPTKRIVCRENRLLALAWMWLRSTRRAARRQIGRWDVQQRFTLGLNGERFRLRPNTNIAVLTKHAKTKNSGKWKTHKCETSCKFQTIADQY